MDDTSLCGPSIGAANGTALQSEDLRTVPGGPTARQGNSEKAFQEFLTILKPMADMLDGTDSSGGDRSCKVTYKCTQCVFSFWHVLDVRFNHMSNQKGRADMLMTWSPELELWRNCNHTLKLNTVDLATYCLARLCDSTIGHRCL